MSDQYQDMACRRQENNNLPLCLVCNYIIKYKRLYKNRNQVAQAAFLFI